MAGSLVNGHSIRSAAEITAPQYLHLEFAEPEMICVHGVACESYVVGRAADLWSWMPAGAAADRLPSTQRAFAVDRGAASG